MTVCGMTICCSNNSSGSGSGRGQRRRFFADATRPLSRRYMSLAQEGTADVMELWQALQLVSGGSTHGSSGPTAKPWTCSAGTRRSAGRGAARSASRESATTRLCFVVLSVAAAW